VLDRRSVEIDQDVAAEDDIERLLASRGYRVAHEIVSAELDERTQPLVYAAHPVNV
jgi:hypothetical protein